MELFWIGEWLFVHNPETGTGTVYYLVGEPTLSIASNYGDKGDHLSSKESAIAYYSPYEPD